MEKYYFTFGCGIDDLHRNCYTVIEANTYSEAREKMVNRFGIKWAFQYEEKDWFIDPKSDPHWKTKCKIYNVDPNRIEPISQAELYNLREIK